MKLSSNNAGGTPASGRLAVEFCDGWLPGRITFPTYATRVAKIRELEAEGGRSRVLVGAIPITSLGETRDDAIAPLNVDGLLENANEMKFWIKPDSGRFTTLQELDGSLMAGTPDDVVREIQRYQEIGCDLLIIDFRMRFADWLNQIEMFAREVLPRVS